MKRFTAVTVIAVVMLALCADTLSAQVITGTVNGWYLKEVRGTAPLEATTKLIPGGGPNGDCAQLFRYAIGNASPPTVLIYEKLLLRDVPLPRSIWFSVKEDHIGISRENFAKMWVYVGNVDTVYPIGTDDFVRPIWLHFSPSNMPWFGWGFLTELVLLDSIDRVQLWFTFADVGPDTVEITLGALRGLTTPWTGFVIDGFGNPLPPTAIAPRAETQDNNGVRFQWNASEGATEYRVQISTDRDFTNVVADDSTITDTAKVLSGLIASKAYWWRVRAENTDGWSYWSEPESFIITTVKDVKEVPTGIPSEYRLDQNYPNPFNPTTVVRFAIPEAARVTIRIFSSLGQEVATIVDERLHAGTYTADWNAVGRASGTYFYELRAGDVRLVKRMVLVR